MVAHPEVLGPDWLPPVLWGRQSEVDELVRRLDAPSPRAPPPWTVGVAGPPGSGSSAVARRAAREVLDRVRAGGTPRPPRLLAVRTAGLRGTHAVATALLRRLDEGFDGRGFSVPEILAGLLRRTRREGRATVMVLDDVGADGPDLAPLLRAVGEPDRFLPEGECGLPPWWTIVAGQPESLVALDASLAGRVPFAPFVALSPYPEERIAEIVRDRASRALGHEPAPGWAEGIARRAVIDGGGVHRAIDLVRRTLVVATPLAGAALLRGSPRVSVEPRVLRAIGDVSLGVAARLGEVKRREEELARSEGARPLPTTTFWRRIVRLEQAGYLRREIRPGGDGGTRSLVRVLTPIDEWETATRPSSAASPGSPRDPSPSPPARVWVGHRAAAAFGRSGRDDFPSEGRPSRP